MITRMDRELGRMVSLIKELNLEEETIFIFTSDNGPAPQGLAGIDGEFFDSNGPLRGEKGQIYEGGLRVPLIVRWQRKIKERQVSDQVTGFEDWLPTLLELAGEKSKTAAAIDGFSFAPVLLGNKIPERPFLYREFPGYEGQQSIRVGDWKGLRRNLQPNDKGAPNFHLELYDLNNDIAEHNDISAQHPDIVAKMEKLMREQHIPSKAFPFPALDHLKTN